MWSLVWEWLYYTYNLKTENEYWDYETKAEIEAHMYDEDQFYGGSDDHMGDVDFYPYRKAERRRFSHP
jgi:hypothetical protein